MGDKIAARNRMAAAGVPVAPGTPDPVPDAQAALAAASEIGYPVMVKAAAGGGGIGMSAAFNDEELTAAYETARTRAERFFSDPQFCLRSTYQVPATSKFRSWAWPMGLLSHLANGTARFSAVTRRWRRSRHRQQ